MRCRAVCATGSVRSLSIVRLGKETPASVVEAVCSIAYLLRNHVRHACEVANRPKSLGATVHNDSQFEVHALWYRYASEGAVSEGVTSSRRRITIVKAAGDVAAYLSACLSVRLSVVPLPTSPFDPYWFLAEKYKVVKSKCSL